MDYDVVVVGSIIVDFICYAPTLPKQGETLHGTKFATGFGGKGCNQVVAAQKLGSKTAILCRLGDDSWGREYREHLRGLGVDTQFVEIVGGESTGIAQICVSSETGANHIVIVVGANARLMAKDVDENVDVLNRSKVLLCQLETPVEGTIRALELMKGVSILNAAPAMKDLPKVLLTLPTIFCVNESEASLVTGLSVASVLEAKAALLRLREMGCRTVIVTLGGDGAIFQEESRCNTPVYHVRIPRVERVLDTTGAGDCFLGALAHSLAQVGDAGLSNLKEAIGRACLVAAVSVQRLGTQSSFPGGKEVEAMEMGFDIIEI